MNDVIISGIVKGEFESVSNDGVKFMLLNKGRQGSAEEFICLAYGNSAAFLSQHVSSGQRVVVQGRLSSEKLDTENYHTAVTVSRVLAITDSSNGMDYTHAVVSGLATSDGLTRLNNANQTALINLNVANKRTYRSNDGQTNEYTTYLGGTLWGETAEAFEASQSFPMENVPVVFEGILKPRTYDNKDGDTINKVDIWVNTISVSGANSISAAPPKRKPQEQGSDTKQEPAPSKKAKSLESSPF